MSKKIAKEEEKHEIIPEPMIEENYLYKWKVFKMNYTFTAIN
jgi:hypothetical protein